MSGRKLLFLTPFPPRLDGHHGGSRAVAHLLSCLAERNRVALLSLRAEDEPPVEDAVKRRCEIVEEVPRRLIGLSARRAWTERRRVRMLLSGSPGWIAGTSVAGFAARISSVARSWQPDVVQVEFLVMAQYLRALDGCSAARVLVDHDPPFRSPLKRRAARAWRQLSRAGAERADAVVVFTERDRALVASLTGAPRIVRIPLGTELPLAPLDPLGQPPPRILFVGSFAHRPNVEAGQRLIESIFPRVLAERPDARLILVGADPPRQLRNGAGDGVLVTGWVEDVRRYLNEAAVVVAPLTAGGGMRVKVLEALAAGKPVVASPLALEGLDVHSGEHVLAADGDEPFAEAVLSLLDDPERRRALARSARSWAEANLRWDATAAEYERLYASLLRDTHLQPGA